MQGGTGIREGAGTIRAVVDTAEGTNKVVVEGMEEEVTGGLVVEATEVVPAEVTNKAVVEVEATAEVVHVQVSHPALCEFYPHSH